MSTIPITSKRIRIPYTILGDRWKYSGKNKFEDISFLILNRGKSLYKSDFFKKLEAVGFLQILSIENPGVNYEIEDLSKKFPSVKFLLLQENCSAGEQINIGMEQLNSRYVCVMWCDMNFLSSSISIKLFENSEKENYLCSVPLLKRSNNDPLPSIVVPALDKKNLKVLYVVPKKSGVQSLFPFDYCGIYNRERFLSTGGYDYLILNEYWQKMDFGLRANLWGEKIISNTNLQLSYNFDFIVENTSIDRYYRIYYLKNLAVKFNGNNGELSKKEFLWYFFNSGEGFFQSLYNFNRARKWVEVNKLRFKTDSRGLTELWLDPEK
jgi:hypothetical protein